MSDDPPICKSNGFALQRKPNRGRITLNAASIRGISVDIVEITAALGLAKPLLQGFPSIYGDTPRRMFALQTGS